MEDNKKEIAFDKNRLVFIGREQDYDPRDLGEQSGSFMDDVYLDPATGKVYKDCYLLGGFVEYKGRNKIEYVK